jgi:hypothetical protein
MQAIDKGARVLKLSLHGHSLLETGTCHHGSLTLLATRRLPQRDRLPLLNAIYNRMKAFALAAALSLLAMPALGYEYAIFSDRDCSENKKIDTITTTVNTVNMDRVKMPADVRSIKVRLEPSDGQNVV